MSLNDQENGFDRDTACLHPAPDNSKQKRHRWYKVFIWCCLLKFLVITPVVIILSLTLFKVKPLEIQIKSSSVADLSPSISFPIIKVDLNITLKLIILVYNPNLVSFKPGHGKSLLKYKGSQVGDVQVDPGSIPSRGSAALVCQVTLDADSLTDSGFLSLVQDIVDRELALEVKTRIPGTAKILFFQKHVDTTSDCRIVIGFLDMIIISYNCKQQTEL
ncbi:hypothetical protein vseg_003567 [Gypsophila vaccaria]